MVGGRYIVHSLGWHCLPRAEISMDLITRLEGAHTIFTTLILGIIKDTASL